MIVTCEQCSTQFQLDDAKVPERGVRVRCSRCKHAFYVKPETGAEGPVDRAVQHALDDEPGPDVSGPDVSGSDVAGSDVGLDTSAGNGVGARTANHHPPAPADTGLV